MKVFLVTLELFLLINFINSEMRTTINQDYYIPMEIIEVNCTSSVKVTSNAIEIALDGQQVALIFYDTKSSSCKTISSDVCKNECSCSLNGRSILFVYNVTSVNQNLMFDCVATSLQGMKQLSDIVILRKARTPTNVSVNATSTITVTEGDSLGPISCAANCIPDCRYNWTGIPGFSSVLYIDPVVRTDEGTYTCEANNIRGTSYIDIEVLVIYGPKDVIIKPSNLSYTIEEGRTLGPISCEAQCIPACTLNWTGPGIMSTSHDLHIPNITRNFTGQFICTATNAEGILAMTVNVTVQYGPFGVSIEQASPVTVTEGKHVGPISCKAECKPDCTFKWIGPSFERDGSILQIDNINRTESGKYRCTAINLYKEAFGNIVVIVQYGPNMITLKPSNQTYTIEEELTLGPISCEALCYPECNSIWIGPGIASATNDLHIPIINRTNAGQFTCIASNNIGTHNMTVDVIVQYAAEVTVMNISSAHEIVTENTSLSFMCGAIGEPKPTVNWFYTDTLGNTNLVSNNNLHIIQSTSCLDTGKYTCLAHNKNFPPHNSSREVNVTCVPRLLKNCSSSYERILAVKKNETKTVYACFLSNPPPRTNWTKQDGNTSSNIVESKSQLYKNSTLQYTAALDVVLVEQKELNVTVNAQNSLGASSTISYRIRIKDRPFAPTDVKVICENENVIHWFSNYNGGSEQNFRIRYTENNGTFNQTTDPIHDKGSQKGHHKVLILTQNTYYSFVVLAMNSINSTTSDAVSCTTRSVENRSQNVAAISGGTMAGLLLIGAIVLVLLFYRRRLYARTTNKEKANTLLKKTQSSQDKDEDAYSLKDNPIYDSHGDKNVEYSVASKHRHQEYANSAEFHQHETDDIYINHVPMTKVSKNTATPTNKSTTNKDGLIYADLDLAPCGSKFVIRGIENRSTYAIIDPTKTAEPLPSSDEDDAKDGEK